MTSILLAGVLLLAAAGCSFETAGPYALGCELQQGNGPRNEGADPPGIPLPGIEGLTPGEADVAAAKLGHLVVFRLDNMTCVCIPPAGYGPVTEGWWGSNGVLWLDLQDVQPQGNRTQNGTGC
jgi:hypothetical protein